MHVKQSIDRVIVCVCLGVAVLSLCMHLLPLLDAWISDTIAS